MNSKIKVIKQNMNSKIKVIKHDKDHDLCRGFGRLSHFDLGSI
jgi:hypothetical protein